jgi:hypothetical protein
MKVTLKLMGLRAGRMPTPSDQTLVEYHLQDENHLPELTDILALSRLVSSF